MDTMTLEVQSRSLESRARDLLNSNLIPAEYYGRGVANKSLQIDYQTFRKLFRFAGTNTVIELNVDGKEKVNVLVHDLQRDPVSDLITHIDFVNVRMDEEIHTHIPLEFVGVSKAVKELGGILVHHLDEIEVKCLPKDLVHNIEVSLDPLVDFHSFVRVKDIVLPPGVAVLNNLEDVVVSASAPRVEEEAAVAPAAEGVGETAATVEGAEPAAEGGSGGKA